jgi:hypothetical protein
MKFFLLSLACCGALLELTGCATITGDKTQQVRVDTFDAQGKQVSGAKCKLVNDYGEQTINSSDEAKIHRSSDDLLVECNKKGYSVAKGVGISRANTAIYGNLLIGGPVGAVIDHSNGKGYSYPQWMSLVFGRTLTFDRKDDHDNQRSVSTNTDALKIGQDGKPVVGTQTAATEVSSEAEDLRNAEFQVIELRAGVSSTTVERLGKNFGCEESQGAGLITDKGPVEIYRMQCKGGKTFLARCELRQCKPLQ